MSNENETIEEKRRKNIIDNQQFLQNLQLFNARDDLKSTVDLVTTVSKPRRKKSNRKDNINQSELRRSSRIQSSVRPNYYNESTIDDEDVVLSSDEISTEEEDDDDLSTVFTNKIDEDWQPVHAQKLPNVKITRPVRKVAKTISNGVKIFSPNTGLQASKVVSENKSQQFYVMKKMNVAISSSSDEEN